MVLVTQDKLFTLRAQEHGLRCLPPKGALAAVREALAGGSGDEAAEQQPAPQSAQPSAVAGFSPAAAALPGLQAGMQLPAAGQPKASAPASSGGLLPWSWAWPGGSLGSAGATGKQQQQKEQRPQQAATGLMLSPVDWPPLSSAKAAQPNQPALPAPPAPSTQQTGLLPMLQQAESEPPLLQPQQGQQGRDGADQQDEGGSSATVAVRAAGAAPAKRREKQRQRQQRRQEKRRQQHEWRRQRRKQQEQQEQQEGTDPQTPPCSLGGSLLQMVKGVLSAAKQLLSSPLSARSGSTPRSPC